MAYFEFECNQNAVKYLKSVDTSDLYKTKNSHLDHKKSFIHKLFFYFCEILLKNIYTKNKKNT